MAQVSLPKGYIYGLELEYSTATSLTVKSGECVDDTGAVKITLPADITKQVNDAAGAWVEGSGTTISGIDEVGVYDSVQGNDCHVFVIYNPTTGDTDVVVSNSYASPNLPSGYTYKRWVGAVVFFTGDTIDQFTYKDEWVVYQSDKQLINTSSTSPITQKTAPAGKKFTVYGLVYVTDGAATSGFRVRDPDSSHGESLSNGGGAGTSDTVFQYINTDITGEVEAFVSAGTATGQYTLRMYKLDR